MASRGRATTDSKYNFSFLSFSSFAKHISRCIIEEFLTDYVS